MNKHSNRMRPQRPIKGWQLVAILLAAALGIIAGFGENFLFGGATSAGPTKDEVAAARRDAEKSMPRLPADIDQQLTEVQFPELAAVKITSDPFIDKVGTASAKTIGPAQSVGGMPRVRTNSSYALSQRASSAPAQPDFNSRVEQWRREYRAAQESNQPIPPKTRVYLLSELTPIGKFTTKDRGEGKGKTDVWFKLEAEQRTFSVAIGTKFYDAELIGINANGPSFRMSNGTIRTVSWAPRDVLITTRDKSGASSVEQSKPEPVSLPSGDKKSDAETGKEGRISELMVDHFDERGEQLEVSSAGKAKLKSSEGGHPQSQVATKDSPLFERTSGGADNWPIVDSSLLPVASQPKARTRQPPAGAPGQISTDSEIFSGNHHPAGETLLGVDRTEPTVSSALPATTLTEFNSSGARTMETETPSATPAPAPAPATPAAGDINSRIAPPASSAASEIVASSAAGPAMTPLPGKPTVRATPEIVKDTGAVPKSSVEDTEPRSKTPLSPLCDSSYKAELIDTEFTSATTLGNLVDKFNTEFGANIVLDNDVQDIPIRLTISGVPWTQFLRIILDLNDLGQVCMDGGLVGIAKRSKLAQIEDQRKRSEPIVQEIFHLKYLQPVAGGRVNLAGQSQGGPSATIQSLEDAIRAILRASGDPRADVRRVPGRNELLVAATREQIERVRDLIKRVDRPGYQVLIKALVYTANENRLKDIGSQLTAVIGNVGQTNLGGFTTLPSGTTQGSGSGGSGGTGGTGSSSSQFGLNPGGIPTLPAGMTPPTNGLAASNAPATFGFTTLVGTSQFSYQLTLAQRKGIVNIQSRPFGIVTDGDTFDLVAGTQIPVVTSSIAGGTTVATGQVQFIEASRIARITPQVADTEDGSAGFVTLNIQLENNAVDTSLGLFNGVPGVNRQSLQTVLRLKDGETAVIGGLSADSVSDAVSKVPGVGDIPVIGNLFKRKTNQETRDRLYFAITVQVIPQESPLVNVPTPSDAVTAPPPPPRAQKPSPYEKRK